MTFTGDRLREVGAGLDELRAHRGFLTQEVSVEVTGRDAGLRVTKEGSKAVIAFHRLPEFFRALVLLEERMAAGEDAFTIEETPAFDDLGLMLDNSRNAVMTPDSIQEMIRHMAVMGYHTLQLYTEDTYELPGHPYFGYMRGRLTEQELRAAEDYALLFGIELVPCIQTLAHLDAIFRWPAYQKLNDIENILLVGDEGVYTFIGDMIGAAARAFRSRRINIGMDEAWLLGQGNYLEKNGFKPSAELMAEHLGRVMSICRKHGLRPMMWSDMFFRSGNPEFEPKNGKLPDSALAKIPQGVTLVHWDYWTEDKAEADAMLQTHKLANRPVVFAGGVWSWMGIATFLRYGLRVAKTGLQSCLDNGIREVLLTAWGDCGGEASVFAALPAMQLYAEACYAGQMDDGSLAGRLRACAGLDLEDALLLDEPHRLPGHGEKNGYKMSPAIYLLYQDALMGLFDRHVDPESFRAHFRAAREKLLAARGNTPRYAYIFDTAAALCDLLHDKCDIGLRLKTAYGRGDNAALSRLRDMDLPLILEKTETLHHCLRAQWLREKKPHGFDVQDLRFGGLIQRLKSAMQTLGDYLEGRQGSIPELEEERLYYDGREEAGGCLHAFEYKWTKIATANRML